MSAKTPAPKKPEEIPWDLFDRCILPVIFSHAAAVILSTVLNVLYISQVSSFTLLLLFLTISVGSTIFYHNLKVRFLLFLFKEFTEFNFCRKFLPSMNSNIYIAVKIH